MGLISKFKTAINTFKKINDIVVVQQSVLQKQDTQLQKQDTQLQKQDTQLQKQDTQLQKQDETIALLNNIITEQQKSLIKQNDIHIGYLTFMGNFAVDRHKKSFGTHDSHNGGELKSSICRMQDLINNDKWVKEMRRNLVHPHLPNSSSVVNRKAWEYVFIAQALYERGMLTEGKKGLGFAVGKEPLPSLFAKYGCHITATDIDVSTDSGKIWSSGNQHASSIDDLFKPDICNKDIFDKNVNFISIDMNDIPNDVTDFDFCWSSCALEHLGSITHGKQFLFNMLNCLKPGGIAVHTTEYNISSFYGEIDNSNNAIFGRYDLNEIYNMLTAHGHAVEELDFRLGSFDEEDYISYPPYKHPHFKLWLDGYISTSFALIIRKSF